MADQHVTSVRDPDLLLSRKPVTQSNLLICK